jgi:DeoR/GlpR family transcriptional regulator of sugar metabolism
VTELAEKIDASQAAIRRDLGQRQQEGLLRRVYIAPRAAGAEVITA